MWSGREVKGHTDCRLLPATGKILKQAAGSREEVCVGVTKFAKLAAAAGSSLAAGLVQVCTRARTHAHLSASTAALPRVYVCSVRVRAMLYFLFLL